MAFLHSDVLPLIHADYRVNCVKRTKGLEQVELRMTLYKPYCFFNYIQGVIQGEGGISPHSSNFPPFQ